MDKTITAGRVRVAMKFREKVNSSALKGQKGKKEEKPEYRKVIYPVWVHKYGNANIPSVQPEDFVFPEFTSEKERIKAVSKQTAQLSISESFAQVYGLDIKVSPELEEQVNQIATELHVGDVVEMTIAHINKNGVVFQGMNRKQSVGSNVNLNRYPNSANMCGTPVKVKVTSVTSEKIVVDPLIPMFESWVAPVVANPTSQKVIGAPQTVKVKDLRLTKGGFVGRAVIPTLTAFLGEEYTVEAFIPGSQIVLNIEDDFEKWVGKTVNAFVTNYITKPGAVGQMSLICSVKEYLKFKGEQNLISMFSFWCEDNKRWRETAETIFAGNVTGIINSAKKCGVFVEIPMLNITGMVTVKPEDLVKYKPGSMVSVQITSFEENTYYDTTINQMRHDVPYVIENGVLTKCSIKPVLKFA